MNAAAELLDGLRALQPEGPDPATLEGKVVQRGREVYRVIAWDPLRRELEVEDSLGSRRKVPKERFYRRPVREIEPRKKFLQGKEPQP